MTKEAQITVTRAALAAIGMNVLIKDLEMILTINQLVLTKEEKTTLSDIFDVKKQVDGTK